MKSKDGHQSKTIGEKGRHPTKNFYIKIQVKQKEGQRLPRTLLAIAKQSFEEIQTPCPAGITKDKNPQEPEENAVRLAGGC